MRRTRGMPYLLELFLEALVWALADGLVAFGAWAVKRWRKKRKKKARTDPPRDA